MKQNLGKLDRIFRFILAVWWLGPYAPQFSLIWVNLVIIILGLIVLLESLFGWCWLHTLLKINNKSQ